MSGGLEAEGEPPVCFRKAACDGLWCSLALIRVTALLLQTIQDPFVSTAPYDVCAITLAATVVSIRLHQGRRE